MSKAATGEGLKFGDFEECMPSDAPYLVVERGGFVVRVMTFGNNWGYAICPKGSGVHLAGAHDWEWTVEDAIAKADEALRNLSTQGG